MDPKEVDRLIGKYLNQEATEAERQQVELWFSEMGRAGADKAPPAAPDAIRRNIWQKLERQTLRRARKRSYRMAAAVALLVAAGTALWTLTADVANPVTGWIANSTRQTYANHTDAIQVVHLADHSAVSLQPGAELSVDTDFSTQRQVYLQGEAFFDIARDERRPFLVHAQGVTTRVLGTSFTVRALEGQDDVVVAVRTGRVEVSADAASGKTNTPQHVVLTPNQQAIYHIALQAMEKKLVAQPQPLPQTPVAIATQDHYTNAPVQDILLGLEKAYGIDIQYDDDALARCTLTSDMEQEGLYERIEIICAAIGGTYVVADTAIVIQANGCQ